MAVPKPYSSTKPPSAGSGPRGTHIFNPDVSVRVIRPDFRRHKFPLVCHVLPPVLVHQSGAAAGKKYFGDFRVGNDGDAFGPFAFTAPMANRIGIGDDRQTFFVSDGSDDSGLYESPAYILTRTLTNAVSQDVKEKGSPVTVNGKRITLRDWLNYIPNTMTDFKEFAVPRLKDFPFTFMQVLVLYHDGRFHLSDDNYMAGAVPGDAAHVLMLNRAQATTLFRTLALTHENENPNKSDSLYVNPDPTDMRGNGAWLVIYNKDHHEIATVKGVSDYASAGVAGGAETFDPSKKSDTRGSGDSGASFASYSVEWLPQVFMPYFKDRAPIVMHNAKLTQHRQTYENVLHNARPIWENFDIPSPEEQLIFLAKAFQQLPELMLFGLRDYPGGITRDAMAILMQRTQSSLPEGSSQHASSQDVADNPHIFGEPEGKDNAEDSGVLPPVGGRPDDAPTSPPSSLEPQKPNKPVQGPPDDFNIEGGPDLDMGDMDDIPF